MAKISTTSLYSLSALAMASILTSCWDDKTSETILTDYSNPLVTSLSFSSNQNVCFGLASYTFTIDHLGTTDTTLINSTRELWSKDEWSQQPGIIFNADSLPVGSIPDSITVSLGYTSPYKVMFYQYDADMQLQKATNFKDTTVISFDDYAYTRLEITARDQATNKSYFVKVNVHTIVGDTVAWKYFADEMFDASQVVDQRVDTIGSTLYWYTTLADNSQEVRTANLNQDITQWSAPQTVSAPAQLSLESLCAWGSTLYAVATDGTLVSTTDGTNWSTLSSDFTFVNLLGVQLAAQYTTEHLCAIVQQGDVYHFAASTDGSSWQLDLVNNGKSEVPEQFPLHQYTMPIGTAPRPAKGNISSRLYIVGGVMADGTLSNSTWSSDGTTWVEFPQNELPHMQGGSIVRYTRDTDKPESLWILHPGQLQGGQVSNTLWFSENSGVTWKKLAREYKSMADTSPIAPTACFSAFFSPKTYHIYYFGGIDATGQQNSQIWGGRYNKNAFNKYR